MSSSFARRACLSSITVAALFVLLSSTLEAQALLPPVPMTPRQEVLLDSGRSFVDQKQYDSAFVVFDSALALNSAAYEVIYEQGLAYRLAGKRDLAVDAAMRGARFDTPIFGDFLVMAAEVLGESDEWHSAADLLAKGLEIKPQETALLVPLGEAYVKSGKSNEARPVLQRALKDGWENVRGHLALANAYGRRRYLVPMVLAFLRMLELDDKLAVGVNGIQQVLGAAGWGVAAQDTTPMQRLLGFRGWGEYADDSRPVNYIERGIDLEYDEGDFTLSSRVLQMSQLRRGGDGYPSNPERFVEVMDHMIQLLPTPRPGARGFAAIYYVPYMKALRSSGNLEAYCYHIIKLVADPAVAHWLRANSNKVAAYKAWAATYDWKGTDTGN